MIGNFRGKRLFAGRLFAGRLFGPPSDIDMPPSLETSGGGYDVRRLRDEDDELMVLVLSICAWYGMVQA